MKKYLPWLLLVVMAAWALSSLRAPHGTAFNTRDFGRLPVLLNGRIQPFDSVARNSLLQMRDKQTAPIKLHFSVFDPAKRGQLMTASEWLVEMMMDPALADTRKVFRLDNPELVDLLKLPAQDADKGEDGKHYSFAQIKPLMGEINQQYDRITRIEQGHRTPFEKQVVKLQNALMLYQRLKVTLAPPESSDLAAELAIYQKNLPASLAALEAMRAGKPYDKALVEALDQNYRNFEEMARYAYPLVVPPTDPKVNREQWVSAGTNLMQSLGGQPVSPVVLTYAKMISAYRQNQPEAFNAAVRDQDQFLRSAFAAEVSKGRHEFAFNDFQPFYRAIVIYVFALLISLFGLACFSLPAWSDVLRRSAYYLVILAWVIHSFGLVYRMVLEGRPPVTNLYSSAVFIGWAAVLLGLVLERLFRLGIGNLVAALSGFVPLVIAHNLAVGGDTMEMMRAVLDSNFWLATHVVTVTLGYSAAFVAGLIALVYVALAFGTRLVTPELSRTLGKMVYGIVCFTTLFSFIGTVLGGIWADQSWGRFWGWDPKENGALMIVLWYAAVLHARWGGWIRERGLMNMAIFGNIITAFSWFGVNMLGVGLHSYGFMDSASKWLVLFTVSQAVVIALGLLPFKYWRSFQERAAATSAAGGAKLQAQNS